MPYINIRLGCKVTNEQKQALYQQTTSLMHEVMGKKQEVTVVNILESEPQQWSVNSVQLTAEDSVSAFVDIKITAGTNTAEEKASMIQKTVEMLREEVGVIQEACYVVIDEIPADSWGYDGKTQAARAAN